MEFLSIGSIGSVGDGAKGSRENVRRDPRLRKGSAHDPKSPGSQPDGKSQSQPTGGGPPGPEDTGWTSAGRRRRPRRTTRDQPVQAGRPKAQLPRGREEVAEALVKRRTLKTQAVTISEPGAGVTYVAIMKTVMASVKLNEIGVEVGTVRRTRAGGFLLQVKTAEEAEKLSGRLQSAVGEMAKIGRPVRTTPVLIANVPDWMEDGEVEDHIRATDLGVAGVSVRIRENVGGGKVALLDVPMDVASRLAEVGKVKIGWSLCRVRLLERRKPLCHRCQKPGHFKAECAEPEAVKQCYRCRRSGHLIKDCPGRPPVDRPRTNGNASGAGPVAVIEEEASQ
ncbi:Zinc finger, CCHC-type [Cinara cedri]|uniref:Zinc finger, CCHC-type n=1 Tax=Cinara cedri TaxID=506608 RepID=A0A5E4NE78_9HEMI|nr:Zinc finger, CCHC-type [Cinara cedri]